MKIGCDSQAMELLKAIEETLGKGTAEALGSALGDLAQRNAEPGEVIPAPFQFNLWVSLLTLGSELAQSKRFSRPAPPLEVSDP